MSRRSSILLTVDLNEKKIPERIVWEASDRPEGAVESKSMSLALWDHEQKNTVRIDLWVKDMPMHEMKRFYVDCLSGMAQSALTATGDEYIANELHTLCEKLAQRIERQA